MITKRAKIIRDTNSGDGIFSIEGVQTKFTLQDHWKSDVAPKTEMVVDATFDQNGALVSLVAVPQNELVKEQLNRAADTAQQLASEVMDKAAATGLPIAKELLQRVGVVNVVALLIILCAWTLLSLIDVRITSNQSQGITFYDLLKIINNVNGMDVSALMNNRGGAGFYGFMCFAVVLAPVIPHFINNKKAWLTYTFPLMYMLIVLLGVYWKIKSSFNESAQAMKALGGDRMSDIASQMASEMMKAISMGMGFYLAMIAALYLAFQGIRKIRSN